MMTGSKKDDYRTELSGRSERILTCGETSSTMMGGLSVLSSAVLKSSETSASCGRSFLEAQQLTPLAHEGVSRSLQGRRRSLYF